eukprot:SAG31_NODE_2431_length_5707_cov_2.157810_5_plen_126_part_00
MKQLGSYSWYNIDRVYDYMLSIGVRPAVVELSFMPRALAECTDCATNSTAKCSYAFQSPGSYKGLVQPPKDYDEWYLLIKALATHLVQRHGLAEVATWRFEVCISIATLSPATHAAAVSPQYVSN